MSEEHLARIEGAIAELRAEMAIKADLAELRAEIKADLAEMRAEMVTKADLAGFAQNVEVAALGRLVRQAINDTAMLRDEVRMTTATLQQLVGTVGGFANLLQALVDQQQRLDDHVRTLEDERQP